VRQTARARRTRSHWHVCTPPPQWVENAVERRPRIEIVPKSGQPRHQNVSPRLGDARDFARLARAGPPSSIFLRFGTLDDRMNRKRQVRSPACPLGDERSLSHALGRFKLFKLHRVDKNKLRSINLFDLAACCSTPLRPCDSNHGAVPACAANQGAVPLLRAANIHDDLPLRPCACSATIFPSRRATGL